MKINVFQPSLGWRELLAVYGTFRRSWVGKGSLVARFEREFAEIMFPGEDLVAPKHFVSISSCTEGLFMAMQLLNIGPGAEVIIPSIHFVGAANAVLACGAKPVFCDVMWGTLTTNQQLIADQITSRTKAVILLHYGGYPVDDLDHITFMCHQRGIFLIEDSANSIGAKVQGGACGTWGDIGLWSFDAMKQITTGDGGMIYCRDLEVANRARRLSFLGLDKSSGFTSQDLRWWEFDVSEPARRSEMNDLQAAIGLVQLKRLPGFIRRRKEITRRYRKELGYYAGVYLPPDRPNGTESSDYFFWVQTPQRDRLALELKARGIYTTFRYYPLHKVPLYGATAALPGAERAAEFTLLLPLHPALTNLQVQYICHCVKEIVKS